MVTIEQVEKLREYANVSYEEAKIALEKNDGDILQALIDLEQEGKTKAPQGGGTYGNYGWGDEKDWKDYKGWKKTKEGEEESSPFKDNMNRFGKWLGEIIHKGNVNLFIVRKRGEYVVKLPLTVMALLLAFVFWIIIPLLVVGVFFGYQYSFEGPDFKNSKVNQVMDSVSQAADDIKESVKK